MGSYKEVKGNLLKNFDEGEYDIIVHGCNCFCLMGAGIAGQIAAKYPKAYIEDQESTYAGDMSKLSSYTKVAYKAGTIINAYTQYHPGANLDYEALTLALRKINHEHKGLKIGLPQIGCGIAGGSWRKVKKIIKTELKDCNVTLVKYTGV